MANQFQGRRVTVMGLGTFGGGLGVVRYLVGQGARVLVTDLRPAEKLASALHELRDLTSVEYRLGEHRAADFTETDLVVVNPAVPTDNEFVRQASDAGVPLTTEIALFWEQNPGQVVAVTGSNGKSTTTALTHFLISSSGRRAWLGGNIGVSLLDRLSEIAPDDWVVLEVSSFQLEWLNRIRARPEIAIVTNFSPNHLDWHVTLDNYRRAKQSLVRWQAPQDWAVLNADDADVVHWPTAARRVLFGVECHEAQSRVRAGVLSLKLDDVSTGFDLTTLLPLPGEHNQSNAAAAIAAAVLAGVSPESIREHLPHFKALPHRLEQCGQADGRTFYNDSIATTPESAICGLKSFRQPIVLLAGGYDKHVDLTAFGQEIADRTRAVVLMGQTAPALAAAIQAARPQFAAMHMASNFVDAFEKATQASESGDVVLLSPGCASYDWFRNFTQRGEDFRRLSAEWCAQRSQ